MFQAPTFPQRNRRSISVLIGIIAIFLFFTSCNNKSSTTDVESSCVTLTSTQVQDNWVGPGYTNPASDNLISYIDFQATYDNSNGSISVTAQGYKADNTAIGNLINLANGTSCPAPLPTVLVGKNLVDMSKLNILDSDGKLKKFNYIKLTPVAYEDGGKKYLTFSIEVVEGNITSERPSSLPCPPCIYCRPPCDTIIDNDDDTTSRVIKDTMKAQ